MLELIIYSTALLFLLAHVVMAMRMYWAVHNNKALSSNEKNSWKVKALVFPVYYWPQYKKIT